MLIGLLLYLALMLAIGAWVSRRIKTETDYLVAGRQLGPALVTFSVFATWFGAETIFGASGSIYTNGLAGGSADPFGYGLALVGAAVIFAVPLWKRKLTTYADLFHTRYSRGVERLLVAIYVPSSVIWAAAQIRAFGHVVGTAAGLELEVAVLVATAFVIGYTLLGGLLADAFNDLVQSIAIVIGLVLIFAAVSREAGGLGASLALVDPERFQPFGSGGRSWLEVIEEWIVPITGSMLAAEVLQRMIAARSPGVARWGTLAGAGLYVTIGLIAVYLGLVGPALAPGLDDPEQLVPTLAQIYLGPVASVLFAGAVTSVILSTVDSALLAAGGFISHNIVGPLAPQLGARGQLLVARASVLTFGIAAAVLALSADSIYELVFTASAFGGAGVFVVSLFAMFTRVGGPASAYAGLIAGLVVWAYGNFVGDWEAPYVVALIAAAAGYVIASVAPGLQPRRANHPL